ncbi:heparinase II/III family protein [Paenibacillus qinlingensis]|uniref:heparinase II/III family protein n=1 Tax=Paenibacillus qinlingensis TaxID=1837343 RepID=UPI001565E87F|nr:heparinase II/III family protein [Paenibacillus qinlingensis]NQX60135.1 heparinase II/III family protein [Paenibacillus qinlingensis]
MIYNSIYEQLADGSAGIGNWLFREDREAVRSRIMSEPEFQPILERLAADAERFLGQPISELPWTLFRRVWEDGFRKTYEPVYFSRRQRLTTFGLLSWLMPERSDYHDGLLDTVWAICGEFSWCVPVTFESPPGLRTDGYSVHEHNVPDPGIGIDLFAAETAYALAEVMMLTGHRWPETIRDRVYREVYRRIFAPFLGNDYFWEHVRNNWAAVCAGSIGAAAIYLIADKQELALVLNKALPTVNLFLEGYGEDGACLEGYMYWGYGFGFYTYFAELLSRRTNGAVDLLAVPNVKQVALFQQNCFLHGRKIVNFSDSPEEWDVYIGLTHEMARRFPEVQLPEYTFQDKAVYDHCGRWAPAFRNLIWYEPRTQGEEWKAESIYLADAQWMVSRVEKEEGKFSFAAKGGNNDEPHNHNDVGHFIVLAGHETFLADIGAGLYTKPYFAPPTRYSFICNSALGHSVPIMDGVSQQAGAAYKATVRQSEITDDYDRFVVELQDAYNIPGLLRLERSWTWHKNGELPWLELEDQYVLEQAGAALIERFICQVQPKVVEKGRVELVGAAFKLVLNYDETLMEPVVEPLPSLNHFGHEKIYYALDMRARVTVDLERRLHFAFHFEQLA